MANCVLVMGESGTGKSRSMKNLNPKETYLISIVDKDLPFRGARNRYKTTKDGVQGNKCTSDNHRKILECLRYINENMPHIKNIVIDDFQYLMFNEFMMKATEKGFEKFTVIQQHAFEILQMISLLRQDLDVFVLSHTQVKDGVSRFKTLGNLLDDKITVEGLFTVVLHSMVENNEYRFLTQYTKNYLAKSPEGMFDDRTIENDLQLVKTKMDEYYNEDIEFEVVNSKKVA
jgi:hypothetical protein